MRIGLVTGEYPPMQGGVGAHCRELAKEFVNQGHSVFVYSDDCARETDMRISIHPHKGRWGLQTLFAIRRWAAESSLDVVNLHFQTAAFQMSPFIHWLPEAVKVPVITTFHDLRYPYLFPKAGPLRDWIVMKLARASAGVISTNHEDFQRLEALANAVLIPIGSSVGLGLPHDFDRTVWRSRLGAGEADFVIAHFGFINHTKGVDTLLQAARSLLDAGVPVRLWFVGDRTGSSDPTNADFADRIESLIREIGLTDRITWTGFVGDEEASAYFASCDVVALLFTDGASYRRSSLMAGIAHGSAILTTLPAVEIPAFRAEENLSFVPANDPESTAAALKELWRSPEKRLRLQNGSRELAREFSWSGIASANYEFFARIVSGAPQ